MLREIERGEFLEARLFFMKKMVVSLTLDRAQSLIRAQVPFSFSKNPLLSALLFLELLTLI